MFRHALGVLLPFAFVAAGTHSLAAAAPTPKLVVDVAPISGSGGTGAVTLSLVGLSDAESHDPKLLPAVSEIGAPNPPEVKVSGMSELPPADKTRSWVIALSVQNLALNSTQQRFITFSVEGTPYTLPYTLTNIPGTKFSWTVRAIPAVAIKPDGAIPISITTGPVGATSVRVGYSTLVEKTTKAALGAGALRVCDSATGPCKLDSVAVGANQTRQVWLRGCFSWGQYEGSILLTTPEKPDGDTVSFTVFCSDISAKSLGVLLIFLGVVIGWYATVYARNAINRDTLLLPAAELRRRLNSLQEAIAKQVDPPANKPQPPNTQDRIRDVLSALSDSVLETNGLPRKVPAPWTTSSISNLDGYRAYVQTQAQWTSALEAITESLEFAWGKWGIGADDKVKKAVQDMGQLTPPGTPPALDNLRTQLTAIENQLVTAMGGAGARAAAGAGAPSLTPAELRVQIARAGSLAWAFILLATTLAGAYIWVFPSGAAGFGTPLDFLTCLAWGFGLSTGSQLVGSTTSSVATTFGVTR